MLALAGTAVQAMVRNPLADPYLLGMSSGASVGATAVLLFGALASAGVWALSAGSVLGALAATVIVFSFARRGGQLAPTQLVLCGVVLAAMFQAVASFLLFRGDPRPPSRCCSTCSARSAGPPGSSSSRRPLPW